IMELRTFVKETLKDILGGIHDAQQEIEQGVIVPALNEEGWKGLETGLTSYQAIDFEVSVNAVEKEGSEAKLNVVAAVIGGGIKGDSSSVAEHTAKLAFKIPVQL
ncbi:hypothetical protein EFU12_003448, partial [Vibrio cholerae]